jgi:hypothetical protein
MRSFALLCAASVLLSLGGCGVGIGTPFGGEMKTASIAQPSRRTICVVSALGNAFAVNTIGLTMFGSNQTNVPVETWQVDEYVTTRVAELVGTRFNIQRVNAPGNAFASLEKSGALFRNLEAERVDIVRKLVLGERCDYHLLVMRTTSSVGTTNQKVSGYGVVRSGDGVIVDSVHLFALAKLVLYENHSYKVLAELPLHGPGGLFTAISGPYKKLESADWPSPPSAADNANLKAGTMALLDAGLVSTLPEVVSIR